jgi:hypothetical protein
MLKAGPRHLTIRQWQAAQIWIQYVEETVTALGYSTELAEFVEEAVTALGSSTELATTRGPTSQNQIGAPAS